MTTRKHTITQGDYKYLVRTYHQNRDKNNYWFATKKEAFDFLNFDESQVHTVHEWAGITDYYFNDTKNYVRKVKKELVN